MKSPEQKDVIWRYPLDEVTESKRQTRMGLNEGFCDELVGVDLRTQGGLRPHPGFKLIYPLTATDNTGWTVVRDFFPVTLQYGTSTTRAGFIIRGTHSGTAKIAFLYYNGTAYAQSDITTSADYLVADSLMDVAVIGRLAYIFVEGNPSATTTWTRKEPLLIYFNEAGILTTVTDTGPGVQPAASTMTLMASATGGGRAVLSPGKYSFVYQLFDTATGRKSQLSQTKTVETTTALPTITVSVSGLDGLPNSPDLGTTHKFDQIRIYRSIALEVAGTFWSNRLMFLEKKLGLTYTGGSPTVTAGTLTTAVGVLLTDEQLVEQETYDGKAIYDEDMPKGGAAGVYQGTLFVGVQNKGGDDPQALGEIRYSHPVSVSPELFPAVNRVTPAEHLDAPIKFLNVGDSFCALSRNYMTMIFKSGRGITFPTAHIGYGVTGQRAAIGMDSSGYVVTPQGFVAVDRTGAITPINSVDKLLLEDWVADLASLYVVYDPPMGCLMIFNPNKHKIVCFWTTTQALSELHHCNFAAAGMGIVPQDSTMLSKRALFITSEGRIFKIDYAREKTVKTLLDMGTNAGIKITLLSGGTSSSIKFNDSSYDADVLTGMYVAFLTGTEKWNVARIVAASLSTGVWTCVISSSPTGSTPLTTAPAAGDVIVLSPVMVKVRGWPLGLFNDKGTFQDAFRGRRARSLGCHFEGVSGTLSADSTVARFWAAVYKGLTATPASGTPVAPVDGDEAVAISVADGAAQKYARLGTSGVGGSVLFPEVTIYAADLDFRLVAMTVTGAIDSTDNRS